jgi:hypothetical protein
MTNLAENKVNKLDADCLCCVPSGAIREASKLKTEPMRILRTLRDSALSLGERVARAGVFIRRRGSGEGLPMLRVLVVAPNVRISDVPPFAIAPAN